MFTVASANIPPYDGEAGALGPPEPESWNLMPGLDDLLKVLPIDQIASKLGVDPATATKAIQEGGGAILGGLQKNASTAEGASPTGSSCVDRCGPRRRAPLRAP
mgnify:CR=1 FL=1